MKKTNWNVTPKEAIALQKELMGKVLLVPLVKKPLLIGGADVSMNRFAKKGFGGFVTLQFSDLSVIDHSVIEDEIPFPYIPGLLSFREIPMLLKAWESLKIKPDVLVVDGVGIAHPRRLGIATHLGLILQIPTIGCAKSVLFGDYVEPANEVFATSPLIDKRTKEIVGMALRTKKNCKPIFVSPGHLITVTETVEIMKMCVIKHRIPEPTRQAHNTVNSYRIQSLGSSFDEIN